MITKTPTSQILRLGNGNINTKLLQHITIPLGGWTGRGGDVDIILTNFQFGVIPGTVCNGGAANDTDIHTQESIHFLVNEFGTMVCFMVCKNHSRITNGQSIKISFIDFDCIFDQLKHKTVDAIMAEMIRINCDVKYYNAKYSNDFANILVINIW